MRSVLKILTGLFLAGLLAASVQAQPAGRYVTGATLYLSTGDWTDIWLNGKQLVDQYPYTSVTKGYVTVRLENDQVCFFEKENILALEMTETLEDHTVQNPNDKIGIAYALELTFSDGGKFVLSSGDENQHLLYKTDRQPDSDPAGWKDLSFSDGSWEQAALAPPAEEITKVLRHPKTNQVIQYLAAFQADDTLKSHHGERRLFRRKFSLDIVPAPPCPQPRVIPTATPRPKPTATPTWTFTPLPRPTATPTFTHTPRPAPTSTPTPRPVIRIPTATPTIVRRVKRVPTFMPTPVPFIPTATHTPIRRKAWPTAIPTRTPIPTPTFTEEPKPVEALPQTIVFVSPPVNIRVSFKDGPGKYKVEVVDSQENHVQTLYEKHVSFERETWLSWDGKNDDGKLMAYGHYSAVFSKDGKVLRHIALEWIPPDNQ